MAQDTHNYKVIHECYTCVVKNHALTLCCMQVNVYVLHENMVIRCLQMCGNLKWPQWVFAHMLSI